jgi:peptidoglycan/LPS O-acetylase OafA/YrhL
MVAGPNTHSPDATRPTEHFARIDGLRALAALSVFFTHVGATRYITGFKVEGFDNTVRAVLDALTIGVKIFFGISGFVLLRPFISRHLAGRPVVRGSGYFTRRAFRIYPAYWVALFGTVFAIRGVVHLHGGWPWIANLALIQGYSREARYHPQFVGMIQAWTLVVEVTFYIFLALYVASLRRVARQSTSLRIHWIGLCVLSMLTIGAYIWTHAAQAPDWVAVLPDQMPLFLCGMLLAVVTAAEGRGRLARIFATLGNHPGLCCGVALAAFAAIPAMSLHHPPPWFPVLLVHMLVVTLLLTAAVMPAAPRSRIHDVLASRPAVFLGTISYGIYLWHYAIVYWVSNNFFEAAQGQTMVKVTAVALPASVFMGWLSYRLIEQPAIRLSRRLGRAH